MTSDAVVGRQQGVLADWNDDRGFGFITPAVGGPRVFVHVSAFPRGRRPVTGCEVTYAELRDERNRARASEVRYVGAVWAGRPGVTGMPLALASATLFFTLLVGLLVLDELPVTLLAAYGLCSGVAFLMYGADKSAAEQGRWRTSESTLHTIALLGGWPGALVARRVFRHKTTKQPFRTIFWFTVIANCVALAWFVYDAPVTLP
ncbi:cold shock and DUF1294 domain-containing protein [Nocardioides sp. zg-1228]|uniref:DUF1294 domain-containing protein n=1 Tax=Nocardioides sp. zg-1228 TaxID=2763008 RepID=UPI001642FC73|nr:cold shock and DUF1294 domain-containing protein [Nocardioides sp. zg-1228]MBC2934015.1 cold shock and DUF1294 domain-containing protein [Nocardioides sp. zg-1228]QSF58771.1 cold shock and DUF1294 domain-containing protein [Nocardioides sp. zg-1228]